MSQIDASLRTVLFYILTVVIVLILSWAILKKPARNLKAWLFALLMNRMSKVINKKIDNDKRQLFAPLWPLLSNGELEKEQKSELKLLEIGAGGGSNFEYYPPGVCYFCVEPNTHFKHRLEDNISHFPDIKLQEYLVSKAEDMAEMPDNYCDAVVSTLVLCQLNDIGRVIKEVKRILRPGGMFFFLEHLPSPSPGLLPRLLHQIGHMLRPDYYSEDHKSQEPKGKGHSHDDHSTPVWQIIADAGFDEVEYRKFTVSSWILPFKHLLLGTATK